MTLPTLRRGGSIVPLRRVDSQSNGVLNIDPWNDFTAMDRLLDNFLRTPFVLADRRSRNPQTPADTPIELYETNDEIVAFLFVPGLDSERLEITATSEQLSIRAERKPRVSIDESTISHTPWVSTAINASSISVSYTLPTKINPEKVTASYKDGVLEIRMSKPETVKPKQVKVDVNS